MELLKKILTYSGFTFLGLILGFSVNNTSTSSSSQPAVQSSPIAGVVEGAATTSPNISPPESSLVSQKVATPSPTLKPTPKPTLKPTIKPTIKPTVTPVAQTSQTNTTSGNTYINSRGNEVQSPTYADSVPAGATAVCGDGTYSFSQSRRGTCSSHGGVARWL